MMPCTENPHDDTVTYRNCPVPLEISDPILFDLTREEEAYQKSSIDLVPNSSITGVSSMELLSSVLTNKYAEGHYDKRYYGFTDLYNPLEDWTKERIAKALNIEYNDWEICVQPLPGNLCIFAAVNTVVNPNDAVLALHFDWDPTSPIRPNDFYSLHRYLDLTILGVVVDGEIDYEKIATALKEKEYKAVISSLDGHFIKDLDWTKLNQLCAKANATLFAEIGTSLGLITSGLMSSPVHYADYIVLSNLTGQGASGAAAILLDKRKHPGQVQLLLSSIFPALQGGPHLHKIAALGSQITEIFTPAWKKYWKNVVKNSKMLCNHLIQHGFKVYGGGTDTNMILIDLRPTKLSARVMTLACDLLNINIEMNVEPGIQMLTEEEIDQVYGVRISTNVVTLREIEEDKIVNIAEMLSQAANLALLCINENDSLKGAFSIDMFEEEFKKRKDVQDALASNVLFAKGLAWIK